jgi:gliding motility-associated-like protein
MTNVWYFGTHAGLKFVGGNPVALSNGQINNGEGCSVECDNYGNLLFYTDGVTVWNKNHTAMPNGTGLDGDYSSTQTVIVRKPGECKQYYVFYTDGQFGSQIWRYSIIDLTLNGGLGDVVLSSKNTFLYSPGAEKITSVRHQNGTDIWIILHGLGSTNNKFLAYLITSTGISAPVISANVGAYHDNLIGYMKASHDGNKIALAITFTPDIRVDVFDFDKSTGVVSNPHSFPNLAGAYGIEFSPNDALLYASTYWGTNHLYQFDLSNYTYQSIASANSGNYDYCALQLGPNGKIYMARGNQNYLSVINNPDVSGTGCNFVSNGFTLAPGTYGVLGLPTFDQSLFDFFPDTFSYSPSGCTSYNFQAIPFGAIDSLKWNFNDPLSGISNSSGVANPTHSFSSNGGYNVSLIIYHNCYSDTIQQLINVTANSVFIDLGNDTAICSGGQFNIDAGSNFSSYNWNSGAHSSSINVISSGTYSVTVTDSAGCVGTDSIHLSINPNLLIDIGNDTSICIGNQVSFNAGNGYLSYIWNTGSSSSSIIVSSSGTYTVTVTNGSGCLGIDSVKLSVGVNLILDLGNDTAICDGSQLSFNAGNGYAIYLWNIGATGSTITVSDSGNYSVTVTDNSGCSGTDSINLLVNPSPIIFLGNDTSICNNNFLNIDAGIGSASYLWNNSSTASTIIASTSGYYSITVSNSFGCTGVDSLSLTVNPTPIVNLGNDFNLCSGENVILDAGSGDNIYNWQDSSSYEFFNITIPGTFWVEVINSFGCKQRDTIVVSYGSDSTDIFIPNVFTPNGDGYNDKFEIKYLDMSNANVKVYNRWGQLLYENKNTTEVWDGTYKGTLCSDGVYFWVIEYQTNCYINTGVRYKSGVVSILK